MVTVTMSDIKEKPILIGVNDEFTPCTVEQAKKVVDELLLLISYNINKDLNIKGKFSAAVDQMTQDEIIKEVHRRG